MSDPIIEAALEYIAKGFRVFPVKLDKKPFTKHGLKDATQSEEMVIQWWEKWPNAGIALVTDGFIVLDFDKKSGGHESKAAIEKKYGPIPSTRTHRTGGGGLHYLYRNTSDLDIRNTVNLGGYKGVDLRANGGYIVAPPSKHESGTRYEVLDDSDISQVPDWLLGLVSSKKPPQIEVGTDEHQIKEGRRNDHLTRKAGAMRRAGFSQNSIEAALLKENEEKCKPPLDEKEVQAIAKSIAQYEPAQSGDTNKKRLTVATQLLELAKDIELFHTPDRMPYAVIKQDDHTEVWPLESRTVKDYLARCYYEKMSSAPSSQAIQGALNVFRGYALFAGHEEPVYTRLAGYDDKIYLDLCNSDWSVVEITAKGWQVIPFPPVHFIRSRGMVALPAPQKGEAVGALRDLLNVASADWPLLLAWLVGSLMPSGPYPVLVLTGEQGSAKSTVARMIRSLVDPSTIPLRSLPREERDLVISAGNSWIIAFDNVSYLMPWLSDALCRLATGGGFATRELYANADEMLFTATRPVILNGIGDIATRSDLLDRAIIIVLPTIPNDKRRTEVDLWKEFELVCPIILTSLLDAISLALRDAGIVKLNGMPRMADFAKWVVAAIPALGIAPNDFLVAYRENIQDIHGLVLESTPVARMIKILASELPDGGEWVGTATELLGKLSFDVGETAERRKDWPKSAKALGGILNRLIPNLRAIGVDITRNRGSGERLIYIRKGKQNYDIPAKHKKVNIVTRTNMTG